MFIFPASKILGKKRIALIIYDSLSLNSSDFCIPFINNSFISTSFLKYESTIVFVSNKITAIFNNRVDLLEKNLSPNESKLINQKLQNTLNKFRDDLFVVNEKREINIRNVVIKGSSSAYDIHPAAEDAICGLHAKQPI